VPDRAALIAVITLERPTCVPCIAAKTDMTVPLVTGYLARISQAVKVERLPAERCRACGDIGLVVVIRRE
jgi:hypothetical protein